MRNRRIDLFNQMYIQNNRIIESHLELQRELQHIIIQLSTPLDNHVTSSENMQETARNEEPSHTTTSVNQPRFHPIFEFEISDISNLIHNAPHISEQQLASALNNVQYSAIQNPQNNTCPITFETFAGESQVTQLNVCGHIFNREAIRNWLRTNSTCPLCRHDIRPVSSQQPQRVRPRNATDLITSIIASTISSALDSSYNSV